MHSSIRGRIYVSFTVIEFNFLWSMQKWRRLSFLGENSTDGSHSDMASSITPDLN